MNDHDGEMNPERDPAGAGRGRYANRWTPESRAAFLRESAVADAAEWLGYVQQEMDGLVAALFAMRVIVCGDPPRNAAAGSAVLNPGPRAGARRCPATLESSLVAIRSEREWATGPHPERERLYSAAWRERMHRLARKARALRDDLEDEVSRHLAGGGLTPDEIERRREETEKLRRAA